MANNLNITALLPDNSEFLLLQSYTTREEHGVTVLVVISCFSMICVVGLLSAISLSAFNTRSSKDPHLFVRTHVAAYFVSLLVSDLIQAIGSILNARWLRDMAVVVGDVCTLQGVLKQTADVSTAFWTLVIAIHTFALLFLELKSSRFTLLTTLIAGWSGIGAIVIAGPAALNTREHGPFYAISGYWCWISSNYPTSRVTLDYVFMFMAALFSFILYSLVFLRMRGNIVLEGGRLSIRVRNINQWRGKQFGDRALAVAKQMLLYPVAYTILILPIAASRFSSFAGDDVPFGVTVFSAAVFLLSGIVNSTLFTMTRRVLPPDSFRIPKWKISKPVAIQDTATQPGVDSYYQNSGIYAESIDDKEKGNVSENNVETGFTVPALRIQTDDLQVPVIMAPPQADAVHRRERDTRVESVYNLYESTSPVPLTPADGHI